jgi:hypothetical protein
LAKIRPKTTKIQQRYFQMTDFKREAARNYHQSCSAPHFDFVDSFRTDVGSFLDSTANSRHQNPLKAWFRASHPRTQAAAQSRGAHGKKKVARTHRPPSNSATHVIRRCEHSFRTRHDFFFGDRNFFFSGRTADPARSELEIGVTRYSNPNSN